MCALIFLDGDFVWGLASLRKLLLFCVESDCSALVTICVTFLRLNPPLMPRCARWHRPDCGEMTTPVGDAIGFFRVWVLNIHGGRSHGEEAARCLHSLLYVDVQLLSFHNMMSQA